MPRRIRVSFPRAFYWPSLPPPWHGVNKVPLVLRAKERRTLLNEAVRGTKHILMSYFASHHHPDNVRARCANTRMNLGNAPSPPLENQFLWRRSTRACRLERWRRPIPPRWWRRGGGDWRRCPLEVISTGINSPSWHRLIPCNWNIFAFRGGRRDCNWW